jgi:hypothetical protein
LLGIILPRKGKGKNFNYPGTSAICATGSDPPDQVRGLSGG